MHSQPTRAPATLHQSAGSPSPDESDGESPYPRLSGVETVAVVDGYGIGLRVERGHLVIRDGLGSHRRERRFSRATCPLRRLLILGHTGSLSLDAIRWCADVGVHIAQLDSDGRVLITSCRRDVTAARVRRVQALASLTSLGLEITSYLLGEKITGQAAVALNASGEPSAAQAIQ